VTNDSRAAGAGPLPHRPAQRAVRGGGVRRTAGAYYGALALANKGATCQLYGYPGMHCTTLSATRRPPPWSATPASGPALITLRSGQAAWAAMRWSPVTGDGDSATGQCQPTSCDLLHLNRRELRCV
jgi:hypothetical protein